MFKKSLLSLLVISAFAFAAEKPASQNFTDTDASAQNADSKSNWQVVQRAVQERLQQRTNFLALEYLLDTASKQKNLSTKTIELAYQLLAVLDGYPLLMEAEWALLKAKIDTNQAVDAELSAFSKKYPNSPYQKRLAQIPFEQLYNQKKFAELVEYSKSVVPENEQNQCRLFVAYFDKLSKKEEKLDAKKSLATENEKNVLKNKETGFLSDEFFKEYHSFWLKTSNIPTECKAIAEVHQKSLTDSDYRAKAVNLVEKNAKEALRSLITNENNELNRWLIATEKVMNAPAKLDEFITSQPQNEQTKAVAKIIFPKWAKTLPEDMRNPTFVPVQQWAEKLALSAQELRDWKITYLNRLFDHPNITFQLWRDLQLIELKADNLTERRLRKALGEGADITSWLALLSNEAEAKLEWRYWIAKNEKDETKRKAMFAELTKERGFYPMLAAQQLGEQYQFKQLKTKALNEEQLRKFSSQFNRLQELRQLDRFDSARMDLVNWFRALSADEKLGVTNELLARGWYDLAVEGTIQAKAFDYINLRLPDAYANWFVMNLKGSKISKTFAQAIARQESAWNAQAKSHANAIGLMQMLPSTAQKTAKDNGLPFAGENDLLKPFNNIMLGTTHLGELNAKYPNNRLLIAGAYNAGASRVDKWLARSNGKLALDEFVASVPFFETRGYIQNVLAYDYYYQQLQNVEKPQMFYKEELERKY